MDHHGGGSDFTSLDFTGIRFPSDRLTVATLRHAYPDLFDIGFSTADEAQPKFFLQPSATSHMEDGVGAMLFCERLIATFAYAQAKGIDGPKDWNLDEFKDELIDYYREFKLATGINHASEMIRDIERQGKELAQSAGR